MGSVAVKVGSSLIHGVRVSHSNRFFNDIVFRTFESLTTNKKSIKVLSVIKIPSRRCDAIPLMNEISFRLEY